MGLIVKDKTLLATSPSIEGIEKLLNNYCYSTNYKINSDLSVSNPNKANANDLFLVVKHKNRYRLYHK